MTVNGLSFVERTGRMISRSGRGRGRAWNAGERARLTAGLKPAARDLFPVLRERLLASRPVIASVVVNNHRTGEHFEKKTYGAPTFRNVLNEKGEWV